MNVASASVNGWPTDAARPTLGAGGKLAAMLVAAAPFLAVAVAGVQNFLLYGDHAGPLLYRLVSWLLLATALVCATAIAMHSWRGIHDGNMAPIRLLLWSVLPCWVIGELAGQYLAWNALRFGGSTFAHAEFSTLRLAGQVYAWTLTGSVCFGLAIACFLWRPPGRRSSGFGLAWLSLVPLGGFALWTAFGGWIESPPVRAGFLGYAFVSLPFVLGLTGAALGSDDAPHPQREWLLAVPTSTLVGFAVIAATAAGSALNDAEIALGNAGPGMTALTEATVDRAIGFGYLGLLLAAVPVAVFAARLRAQPRWKAFLPALALALLSAGLIVIDLALDRPARGMAEPYTRRLMLLLAFLVAAPLATSRSGDSTDATSGSSRSSATSKMPRALEPLVESLDDSTLCDAAAEALGKLGDDRAVEPLSARLRVLRDSAANALGRIGDPRAIAPLISYLRRHETLERTRAGVAALGAILRVRAAEASPADLHEAANLEDLRCQYTNLFDVPDDQVVVEDRIIDCSAVRALARAELDRRGAATPVRNEPTIGERR